MAKRTFKAGATSQTIDIFIQDSTKTDGSGLSGLVFNTSNLKCYYRKNATGTATAVTLATQTVGGAWSSGGFVEIDATNMKGVYRFDIPDTVLATSPWAILYFYGATNMAPTVTELEIVAVDPFDGTTFGLSRIDAAITSRMAAYTQPTGFIAATFPTTVASTTNITTAALGATERSAISDTLLDRDLSTGTDSGSTTVRTPRQALRFLRNKWDISGTTLTVKKEDDSTTSWTGTITSDPTAAPVTGTDPAGS